jgi:hypothetical protein
VAVSYDGLLAVLPSVRPGSVIPWTADVGVGIEAPAVGRVDIPLRTSGDLPVPAPPEVRLTDLRWETLGLEEARAVLTLAVRNENRFAVDLTDLDYTLALGGRELGRARLERAAAFAAGGEQVLSVPFSFSPRDLGLAALGLLAGAEGKTYALSGSIRGTTPYGPVELPFERSGRLR